MTGIRFDNEAQSRYNFEYGANGRVCRLTDTLLNRIVTSEYDSCDRPMRVTHTEQGTHLYTGEVSYDCHNSLSLFREQVGSARKKYSTAFTYDVENKPLTLTYTAEGASASGVSYSYA